MQIIKFKVSDMYFYSYLYHLKLPTLLLNCIKKQVTEDAVIVPESTFGVLG